MSNTCKADETPEFKTFWEEIWRNHMRHTDGRGDAREAFRKHILKGADPRDIVDGARAFIRNHEALPTHKQEYIPLAASWLNKQSYEDWCEKERAYQERISMPKESSVVPIRAVLPATHFMNQYHKERAS